MHDGLREVVKHFDLEGKLIEIAPLSQGHINDTYILTGEADGRIVRHVLQRINHEVFKNPPAMMANIVRITEHIHGKLQRIDPELASRQLTVICANNGDGYWTDHEGNYWRIYDFIEQAVSYDTMDSPELAGEAARMFGWFQQMLNDLPGPVLHESIPDGT